MNNPTNLTANETIGQRRWAIAEGYIPNWKKGPVSKLTSRETISLLNTTDTDAEVHIMIYFNDREPVGPYHVSVPARRMRTLSFDDLINPQPIPFDTMFSSVIESNVPIVVQHVHLDPAQTEKALLGRINR